MSILFKKSLLNFVQEVFWPIKKEELKLFLPMSLLMLCILFNFGALRSIKDSLVVPVIGAEVISFLKLWFVLPCTVLFTIIFVKLSNIFSYQKIFYIIVSSFLGAFAFFTYILYPMQSFFHPNQETIQLLAASYPHFKWLIMIIGKWSYAFMYVCCELWSTVIINLLFWQFTNHIFDTKSAKRFYPIFGMIGNIGLILAGNLLVKFSGVEWLGIYDNIDIQDIDLVQARCGCALRPMINVIIFFGLLAMLIYWIINTYILPKSGFVENLGLDFLKKTKLSVRESFKLVVNSKYIGYIVLLIFCYGLLINILEGPWKARVREIYPNTIDYMNFMGKFNIWMGVSCITFSIIGGNVVRRLSWFAATLFTPLMVSVTGFSFFTFVLLAESELFSGPDLSFDPIYFAVIIGAAQNILSKSTKYSLFDSTKELAYIPLSLELKVKGKAAAELVGMKFGKSFGAVLQSFVFILFPAMSFDSLTIYLMIIFTFMVVIWVWDITQLNKEYLKLKGSVDE